MKLEIRILLIHVIFALVIIITFLRCLFSGISFFWILFLFIAWFIIWVNIYRDKKGRYHDRLNKKKKSLK